MADVSGHGVPAALIPSMVKLAAASQPAVVANPSQSVRHSSLCPPELRVWRIAILRCSASVSLAG